MTRKLLLGVASLVLALCSLPSLAASADPAMEAALAAIFAPVPESGGPPEAQDVAKRPQVTPKGSATANCWDGSTKTCYGSSVYADDSSCPGERGYCTGTTTGRLDCPPCPSPPPTCFAWTGCCETVPVYCEGSYSCFSVEDSYVYCDGHYYHCPFSCF